MDATKLAALARTVRFLPAGSAAIFRGLSTVRSGTADKGLGAMLAAMEFAFAGNVYRQLEIRRIK